MKPDLYQRITSSIVSSLERGVRPWLRPWPLRSNGVPYQGINVLMLWGECVTEGYGGPLWMTFKQALELVGCVRKGEHGSLVV